MKKIISAGVALIFFGILFSGCSDTRAVAQSSAPSSVTYQTFYDDLSPYGSWIDYSPYGNVWDPNVAGDFRPYFTNGYWSNTNEGNLWMSDYSWGWAPFHYGRWIYDDVYGWLWIPGYEWSPAWVTWGMMDGFYAWAPLLPGVNVGINYGGWRPAPFYWNIVNQKNLYDRHIMNVAERRDRVTENANRINIINNFGTTRRHNQYYSKGPDNIQYQKSTGVAIQPVNIRESKINQGNKQVGNDVQVYRPTIDHPQPKQTRRVNNVMPRPVINDGDRISTPREEQMQNIQRLPVHAAPAESFDHGNMNPRVERSGRRN